MIPGAIEKLKRTFEVAPWLKDAKNAVHLPVLDPTITNYPKPLPQLTWAELHAMMEKLNADQVR
jgi:hypothetical protein